MHNINTVNDFMNTVAEAVEERDFDALDTCASVAKDWLQPEDERNAQLNLIESVRYMMMDAAEA